MALDLLTIGAPAPPSRWPGASSSPSIEDAALLAFQQAMDAYAPADAGPPVPGDPAAPDSGGGQPPAETLPVPAAPELPPFAMMAAAGKTTAGAATESAPPAAATARGKDDHDEEETVSPLAFLAMLPVGTDVGAAVTPPARSASGADSAQDETAPSASSALANAASYLAQARSDYSASAGLVVFAPDAPADAAGPETTTLPDSPATPPAVARLLSAVASPAAFDGTRSAGEGNATNASNTALDMTRPPSSGPIAASFAAPSGVSPAADARAVPRAQPMTARIGSEAESSPAVTSSTSARAAASRPPLPADVAQDSGGGNTSGSRDQRFSGRSSEPPSLLSPQAAHAVQTFVSIGSPSSALERAPAEGTAVVSLPNETAVVSSIVQSMRLQATSGGGTAIVTLDPGYLGDVSIALQVQHGMVTATVHAANGDVREWLQANEAVLGRGLAAHGLSLDRLVVADARTAEEAEADGRRQPPQQGQEQETPRHTPRRAAAGTFEVVV